MNTALCVGTRYYTDILCSTHTLLTYGYSRLQNELHTQNESILILARTWGDATPPPIQLLLAARYSF